MFLNCCNFVYGFQNLKRSSCCCCNFLKWSDGNYKIYFLIKTKNINNFFSNNVRIMQFSLLKLSHSCTVFAKYQSWHSLFVFIYFSYNLKMSNYWQCMTVTLWCLSEKNSTGLVLRELPRRKMISLLLYFIVLIWNNVV